MGRFGFADQTALRISAIRLLVPVRGLRIEYASVRRVANGWPQKSFTSKCQYTVSGAFSLTPSSRTSATTPIISRQGFFGVSRTRRPTAAPGFFQYLRAKPSETITTGALL